MKRNELLKVYEEVEYILSELIEVQVNENEEIKYTNTLFTTKEMINKSFDKVREHYNINDKYINLIKYIDSKLEYGLDMKEVYGHFDEELDELATMLYNL